MGVPGYTRVGAHLVGGGSPQGEMGREHIELGRLWEQRRGREEQLESGDSERAGLAGGVCGGQMCKSDGDGGGSQSDRKRPVVGALAAMVWTRPEQR